MSVDEDLLDTDSARGTRRRRNAISFDLRPDDGEGIINEAALAEAAANAESLFAVDAPLFDQTLVARILAFYFGLFVLQAELPIRANVVDNNYLAVAPTPIVTSIKADPILSPSSYINDVFDCDDYVMYLRTKLALWAQHNHAPAPLAIGFLTTRVHAFNFCIDDQKHLFLINTQSDTRPVTGNRDEFATFMNLSAANSIRLIYI